MKAERTDKLIENMLERAKVTAEAKEYATYQQYETLAKLLEERGTMPQDLSSLCSLLYQRPYARLSRDHAADLMRRIAAVPADQQAMRFWVSNTVTGMMSGWVNEGKDA